MLVKEVIQRVQNLYSKGVPSDDSRLSARHIYNKLISIRSLLITRKLNKKQLISQWTYQTLPCVELIKVPIHDCPCVPPLGCDIYRTKYKLPKPLVTLNHHAIQSVTNLTGELVFTHIAWSEVKYQSHNKYSNLSHTYFIRNEYLYIVERKTVKVITITGLFEDLTEVLNFPSNCNDEEITNCESPLDTEFFIDSDLIDPMIELSSKELIELYSKQLEDTNTDTYDDNNKRVMGRNYPETQQAQNKRRR